MKEILKLLRVKHYIKNLFIFLPAFFSLRILDLDTAKNNVVAFLSFSLISSAIYIFNDILDRKSDQQHPEKKNRPIASGSISIKKGLIIMIFLLVLGMGVCLSQYNFPLTLIISLYLFMNIVYTFWLKHIGILDVFILASFYLIRILVGGYSANITINFWIIIMTFLLALFLGFAKRRDDVILRNKTGKSIRKSTEGYNLKFLDSCLLITSSTTLVSYLMYTVSTETINRYNSNSIYITAIFVLLGILRYLQITIVLEESNSPTDIIYKDKIIQISIMGWILSFILIIYL